MTVVLVFISSSENFIQQWIW